MVTILRPRFPKRGRTSILDENIPESEPGEGVPGSQKRDTAQGEKGIELSAPENVDATEDSTGSSSAPGEGPNPTV